MITLGYISNQSRKFTRYVERRASIIQQLTPLSCWHYVPTELNPADHASRPRKPKELLDSNWFTGPDFLWDSTFDPDQFRSDECIDVFPEEKPSVTVLLTHQEQKKPSIFHDMFIRKSSFLKQIQIMKNVLKFLNRLVPKLALDTSHEGAAKKLVTSLNKRSSQISREPWKLVKIFLRKILYAT